MKVLYSTIGIALACAAITTEACYAAISSGGRAIINPTPTISGDEQCKNDKYKICLDTVTYGSDCASSACYNCAGSTSMAEDLGSVTRTLVYTFNVSCPSNVYGSATCSCSTSYKYTCNIGYYGYATSSGGGCTACPANATCAGGNNSTFTCNSGYTKNGDKCEKSCTGTISRHFTDSDDCTIPNATLCDYDLVCDGCGNNCVRVNEQVFYCTDDHWYTNSDFTACHECPGNGVVDWDMGNKGITACYIPAGTLFSDSTGSGVYGGNCYYE